MNEEYLWDKTGEDAEIERLETMLAAFRYKETAAPALPSKILAFQPKTVEKVAAQKTPRRFSYALAACAAVILIACGAMFQISFDRNATENDLAQAVSTDQESIEKIKESKESSQLDSTDDDETFTLENVETSPSIEVSKQIIKQFKKTIAGRTAKPNAAKTIEPVSIQNKTFVRKPETEHKSVALTDEEKHAYDQLMLALSITSSKLKIVKDKIDGVEESAVLKNER